MKIEFGENSKVILTFNRYRFEIRYGYTLNYDCISITDLHTHNNVCIQTYYNHTSYIANFVLENEDNLQMLYKIFLELNDLSSVSQRRWSYKIYEFSTKLIDFKTILNKAKRSNHLSKKIIQKRKMLKNKIHSIYKYIELYNGYLLKIPSEHIIGKNYFYFIEIQKVGSPKAKLYQISDENTPCYPNYPVSKIIEDRIFNKEKYDRYVDEISWNQAPEPVLELILHMCEHIFDKDTKDLIYAEMLLSSIQNIT